MADANLEGRKRVALATIDEACRTYGCREVYCLYSGGDDSQAALRVAVEDSRFRAALFLDTGTGAPATLEHARQTCRQLRAPLLEYRARENVNAKGQPDPQNYEDLVTQYGFPGPTKFGHGKMYIRLKDRSICRFFRERLPGRQPVVLCSGCRSNESARRMGTTVRIQRGEPRKDGSKIDNPRRVWVNHIHDWAKQDTLDFSRENTLPRNPVSQALGRSGECNCGAFATEGELERMLDCPLTRGVAEWILDLEKKVRAAGFPWGWGERVPAAFLRAKRGQRWLFDVGQDEVGPLCRECDYKALATEESLARPG